MGARGPLPATALGTASKVRAAGRPQNPRPGLWGLWAGHRVGTACGAALFRAGLRPVSLSAGEHEGGLGARPRPPAEPSWGSLGLSQWGLLQFLAWVGVPTSGPWPTGAAVGSALQELACFPWGCRGCSIPTPRTAGHCGFGSGNGDRGVTRQPLPLVTRLHPGSRASSSSWWSWVTPTLEHLGSALLRVIIHCGQRVVRPHWTLWWQLAPSHPY